MGSTRTSAESSEQKLTALVRWLEENGAVLPKLRIVRQENGERCVLAAADIAEGEAVLQLPRSLLLTHEAAKASGPGLRLQAASQVDNDLLYLAAFLLHEKHQPDSFWRPYIDSLPEAFPHLPRFFEAPERALLQGSQLLERLEFQDETFRQEYALLCQSLPDFERHPLEEYIWARLALNSRMFGLKGGLQGPSCVPMADMLNHRNPPDVGWTVTEEGQRFVMTARRSLRAGEEVFNTYGEKSNDLSLLHCGFLTEDNPHEEVLLSLGLMDGDPFAELKQQLLSLSSPTERLTFPISRQPGYLTSWSVLAFLRLTCASPDEFQVLCTRLPTDRRTLSVACEARVLRALTSACEERLAGFPTSLEEDERMLRDASLSPNARTCVLARLGEKQLLHEYLEMTRTGLALLHQSREEFEWLVADPHTHWGWFDGYVREDLLELVRAS